MFCSYREIFENWKKEACSGISFAEKDPLMISILYGQENDNFDEKFIMYTNRPSWYRGKDDKLIEKYKNMLSMRHGNEVAPKRICIEFVNVDDIIM